MTHSPPLLFSVFLLLACTNMARAERADRDQPVKLEADRVTVDEKQKLHIFEGNVQLVQGTLTMRTSRLQVTQDKDGFQKGVALGGADGLARFRQKREGMNEYVEGEAERIDLDNRAEKTEFHGRARVKSGLDEVTGQYIVYDAKTENYVVSGSPAGTRSPGGAQERVRAVIQPKNKEPQK